MVNTIDAPGRSSGLFIYIEWEYTNSNWLDLCLRHDQIECEFSRQSQESEFANVAKGAIVSLGRIAGCISNIVQDSSEDPDATKGSRCDWVFESCKHQHDQIGRESLESVLMDALIAIEDVLFVVLLAFCSICIREGQRDLSEFAIAVNAPTQEGDQSDGEQCSDSSLMKKKVGLKDIR